MDGGWGGGLASPGMSHSGTPQNRFYDSDLNGTLHMGKVQVRSHRDFLRLLKTGFFPIQS